MQSSPKRSSVMKHNFSQVPKADIPRSSFDRTHGYKTTFDSGYLIPFFVDEALPGDTFNLNATLFSRMATPLHPVMDNMTMDVHYFAVPIRLIWDNFQKFMGEQVDPDSSTDFLTPIQTAPSGGYLVGSMSDYFGIPTEIDNLEITSLHHRAYNLIWNEWFRDQNLQDSVVVDTDDGPDDPADYEILKRGKRHDYFTSSLPWPQKGPGVELPLGSVAPVVTNDTTPTFTGNGATNESLLGTSQTSSRLYLDSLTTSQTSNEMVFGDESGLEVDLSSATAATINSLRQAFQLQKLYERDARGGTRYTEIIRAHFGTVSPDSRLQRPEYLGGSSSPVNIVPVPQTVKSTAPSSPKGDLGGFGTVADSHNGFVKSFTEHCVIMGFVSVRADLTYQSGIPKMFSRRDRFDFYWPALSHLGEQSVLNKEIYAQGTSADDEVFGYQERWAEYRYFPSKITGQLRSSFATSLDLWHLSQEFTSLPTLSSDFIEEDPPIDRIVATPDDPQFIFDSYINLKCARPMPVYSVPGLIDHF